MQNKVLTKIILSGLIAVISGSATLANAAGAEIYGKAFLTVQNSEEEATAVDKTELLSNASRIGFKGESDLDNGLKVIYQGEYETKMDDGTPVFAQRNIFAGLKGGFGTLVGGKNDSPLKLAQNKIDLFNDLSGDFKGIFQGENRPGNIIMYTTPDFSGFQVTAASILSEANSTPAPATAEDGLSVSAAYTKDKLYLALAIDSSVGSSQLKTATRDITRLVGQFSVGSFTFGLMSQTTEKSNPDPLVANDDKSESGVFASVAYKMGNVTLKAQTGASDELLVGGEQTSLGLDYKLGGKTKVFGFYTDLSVDAANSDRNYVGLGLEHNF